MMKKNFVWIFPFALYRIDAFANYLTEMRQKGLMLEKVGVFGVLHFKRVKPRNDLQYVILTSRFPMLWFRIKNWDTDFMKKQVCQFDKSFHKVLTVSSFTEYRYHIYFADVIHSESIEKLQKHRKKRLVRVNIYRTVCYIFMFLVYLGLLWGIVEAIKGNWL